MDGKDVLSNSGVLALCPETQNLTKPCLSWKNLWGLGFFYFFFNFIFLRAPLTLLVRGLTASQFIHVLLESGACLHHFSSQSLHFSIPALWMGYEMIHEQICFLARSGSPECPMI